jgi:hypothetical protein
VKIDVSLLFFVSHGVTSRAVSKSVCSDLLRSSQSLMSLMSRPGISSDDTSMTLLMTHCSDAVIRGETDSVVGY